MGIQSDTLKVGWKHKKVRIRSLVNNAEDNLDMANWQFPDPKNPVENIAFDDWYKAQQEIKQNGDWIVVIRNFYDFIVRSRDILSNIVRPRVIEPLRDMLSMLSDAEIIISNQEKEITELKMLNGALQDENEELAEKNIVLQDGIEKMKEEINTIKSDYKELFDECNGILERAVKKINFTIEEFNTEHKANIDNIDEIDKTSKEKQKEIDDSSWKTNYIREKKLDEKFEKWTSETKINQSFNGLMAHCSDDIEKAKVQALREEYKQKLREKLANPPKEELEEEDIPDVENMEFSD